MNQFNVLKLLWPKPWFTFGFLFTVFFLITGCTIGGVSSVNKTLESSTDSFDKAFANAIRAMNDVGKVTNTDKQIGYVNGISHTGVDLVVTLEQMPAGGVKLNTKAAMPGGKIGLPGAQTQAANKFVEAYKQYSQ